MTCVMWTLAARPQMSAGRSQPASAAGEGCTNLGEQVSRADMTDVAPQKLSDQVRVLNASGRGGQAAGSAIGFAQPTAANDPIYAGTRLDCQRPDPAVTAGQAAAHYGW